MKIIGNALAERVAAWTKDDFFPVIDREFADGELCPRFESSGVGLEGETAALILQKDAGENVNSYFLKYLLLLNAIKDAGASHVIACMPYFAYARQHKQYLQGQPVSSLAVSRLLEFCGAERFLTVNSHEPGELARNFTVPTTNISAASLLAEFIARKEEYRGAVVVAPDDGAADMAGNFASLLGSSQVAVFEKKRDIRTGDITLETKNVEMISGKSVVVVDDMVSTGTTMVETARACSRHGAKKVASVFVHPVLAGNALERLRACCDDIIATNTIQSEVSQVDASPILAQALSKIAKGI